jgi:hypothetical protein
VLVGDAHNIGHLFVTAWRDHDVGPAQRGASGSSRERLPVRIRDVPVEDFGACRHIGCRYGLTKVC